MTRRVRLAVVGHPVAHSLSPVMHGAALAALGRTDVTYEAVDVAPSELRAFVGSPLARELLGFNVTLPHKESIVPHLAEVDAVARAIGAVNTVYRDGERLVGTNTDAAGLVRALVEADVALADTHAIILGAGGAARAAIVGLSDAGAATISVVARRVESAESVVRALRRAGTTAHGFDALPRLVASSRLLVQATSAMLSPDASSFARALPWPRVPGDAVVVDLVYRPRQTAVLEEAHARGLRTVDGTGMLIHQGAAALARWLGVPAPVEAMREALSLALGG